MIAFDTEKLLAGNVGDFTRAIGIDSWALNKTGKGTTGDINDFRMGMANAARSYSRFENMDPAKKDERIRKAAAKREERVQAWMTYNPSQKKDMMTGLTAAVNSNLNSTEDRRFEAIGNMPEIYFNSSGHLFTRVARGNGKKGYQSIREYNVGKTGMTRHVLNVQIALQRLDRALKGLVKFLASPSISLYDAGAKAGSKLIAFKKKYGDKTPDQIIAATAAAMQEGLRKRNERMVQRLSSMYDLNTSMVKGFARSSRIAEENKQGLVEFEAAEEKKEYKVPSAKKKELFKPIAKEGLGVALRSRTPVRGASSNRGGGA